jgi:hypothetical protein
MIYRQVLILITVLLVLSVGYGGICTGLPGKFGQTPHEDSLSLQTGTAPASAKPYKMLHCQSSKKRLFTVADSYSSRIEKDSRYSSNLSGGMAILQLTCHFPADQLNEFVFKPPSFSLPPVYLMTCSLLC